MAVNVLIRIIPRCTVNEILKKKTMIQCQRYIVFKFRFGLEGVPASQLPRLRCQPATVYVVFVCVINTNLRIRFLVKKSTNVFIIGHSMNRVKYNGIF